MDRYRIYHFKNQADLLAQYGKQGYRRTIGYAGWGFSRLADPTSRSYQVFLQHFSQEQVDRIREMGFVRLLVDGDVVDITSPEGIELEGEEEVEVAQSQASQQDIAALLSEGQELLVQVTKEPIGTKGPRVTTQVSLPGRFIVYMPDSKHVGVSRKIDDRPAC